MREAKVRKGWPGNGKPWLLAMVLDRSADLTEDLLKMLGFHDTEALERVCSINELKALRK